MRIPEPVKRFAINSQTEYNSSYDFIKFWKILRGVFFHKHFSKTKIITVKQLKQTECNTEMLFLK